MSTFRGLPAHVLLVHGMVVLVPLTAALLIICALWPRARKHFIWLAAAGAVTVTVLTPVTTNAGEWLEHKLGSSPAIEKHAELGDDLLYYIVPLLIAAVALVLVHLREGRNKPVGRAVLAVVAVLVVAAGATATVQTYRVGDSGARAVWSGVAS